MGAGRSGESRAQLAICGGGSEQRRDSRPVILRAATSARQRAVDLREALRCSWC